jgi:hypothetical protein
MAHIRPVGQMQLGAILRAQRHRAWALLVATRRATSASSGQMCCSTAPHAVLEATDQNRPSSSRQCQAGQARISCAPGSGGADGQRKQLGPHFVRPRSASCGVLLRPPHDPPHLWCQSGSKWIAAAANAALTSATSVPALPEPMPAQFLAMAAMAVLLLAMAALLLAMAAIAAMQTSRETRRSASLRCSLTRDTEHSGVGTAEIVHQEGVSSTCLVMWE